MRILIYKSYCWLHYTAKYILNRSVKRLNFRMISGSSLFSNNSEANYVRIDGDLFNEMNLKINNDHFKKKSFFFEENIVSVNSNLNLKDSFLKSSKSKIILGIDDFDTVLNLWNSFIENSRMPTGFRNESFHFAGFIADEIHNWCLPSWIWTNAAIVRYYCNTDQLVKAKNLAKRFIEAQHFSGGWIVRFDYTKDGPIPVLAANDSAYIANHSFLELYICTGDEQYLDIAVKCAEWIMDTARQDGLVWTGYDTKNNKWLKDFTIVDTAFTAGFFSRLYKLTSEDKYLKFLEKFCHKFIELFYHSKLKGFATSLDSNNVKIGGLFTRGQAWALEGLIPAFEVTQSSEIKEVITSTIDTLISKQLANGGWPYNLSQPLLGEDCKGVPVIAMALLNWDTLVIESSDKNTKAVKKASNWCINRTSISGKSKGGIFSFNAEGAIVHNNYSSTAFVYSSVYAFETLKKLQKHKK